MFKTQKYGIIKVIKKVPYSKSVFEKKTKMMIKVQISEVDKLIEGTTDVMRDIDFGYQAKENPYLKPFFKYR